MLPLSSTQFYSCPLAVVLDFKHVIGRNSLIFLYKRMLSFLMKNMVRLYYLSCILLLAFENLTESHRRRWEISNRCWFRMARYLCRFVMLRCVGVGDIILCGSVKINLLSQFYYVKSLIFSDPNTFKARVVPLRGTREIRNRSFEILKRLQLVAVHK